MAAGAYSAPPDPLAAIRGPTSKGRGGKGRGREGRGGGREGGEDLTIPIHICFRRPCIPILNTPQLHSRASSLYLLKASAYKLLSTHRFAKKDSILRVPDCQFLFRFIINALLKRIQLLVSYYSLIIAPTRRNHRIANERVGNTGLVSTQILTVDYSIS